MRTELDGSDGFNEENFKLAVMHTLRQLQYTDQDILIPSIMGLSNNNVSLLWSKNLHDSHIRNLGELNPDASQASSPSNKILNFLSLNINQMALNQENHLVAPKELQKKCKFESLEPFIKSMILNTLSISGSASTVDRSPYIKSIMNCTSISRAQIPLNHFFQNRTSTQKYLFLLLQH